MGVPMRLSESSIALDASPESPTVTTGRRAGTRGLGQMFLVLLALTFVLRFPAFFVPVFNSDETFLATQAHVIRDGGQLYEDAADRKPPLVPYVYAATFAFFGTSALWSVRVVAMLAVALTALLLAVEARRRYGTRAGWIAGVMFVRRDGRVRAPRRTGRQFRSVHAPRDGRVDVVRAPRQGHRGRGDGCHRDDGQTDRRRHVAASALPACPRPGQAGFW